MIATSLSSLLAVSYTSLACRRRAINMAKRLQISLVEPSNKEHNFLLVIAPDHVELQYTQAKFNPVWIDFSDASLIFRKTQKQTNELLMRAIGATKKNVLSVVDATAGLGTDGFLMASFGCRVTLLERSPVLYELLRDAMRRYRQTTKVNRVSLRLLHQDAIHYLSEIIEKDEKPDIVYLDPMFPHRTKSALVKKEMRFLREIVGEDLDADQLLLVALRAAKKRVVVKRPRLAPHLANRKPDFSQTGKSCRFDVYLIFPK